MIVAAGLALKFLEPTLYAFGTVYDDQMMVQMAHGFLLGHWSSSWAATGAATLTKPVGYPIFLAAVHAFPWSPVFSAYVLYVIGVGLIAWSWFRLRGSRLQVTLLLAILVFNPISFTAQNQRVYRDLFIMALFTLAVGVALFLASLLGDWTGDIRSPGGPANLARRLGASAPRRWAVAYPLVAALGLIVGFAAITKETWVWLLPAAIAPLVYPFIQRLRPSRFRFFPALRAGMAGVMFLGCVWGVSEITKQLNEKHYQVAVQDDLFSSGVARAWKMWARVEAGPPRKFVPITRSMRLAVYRVSPTAAEMAPLLESRNDQWKALDCESLRICDESGPWFEFDLLTSSVQTGKVSSVKQVVTYFSQIADDISRSCESGRLHCSNSPVLGSGLPTLNQIPLSAVASDTVHGLWQMIWDPLPLAWEPYAGAKVTPATRVDYDLWASVVPDMPTLAKLTVYPSNAGINPILSAIEKGYRIADLLLLAAIGLAIGVWFVALVRQKVTRNHRAPREGNRPDPEAGVISILLCISAVIGMGTLATFEVASDPDYMTALFWTDFSSVAQLGIVFGLFSLVPLVPLVPLGQLWHRNGQRTQPLQPQCRADLSGRLGVGVE